MATTKVVPFSGTRKASNLAGAIQSNISMFAQMTLDEIGYKYGLEASDVKFVPSDMPNNPNPIWSLRITVPEKGVFHLPLSRGFDKDYAKANPDWFLRCEVRSGFKSVKNPDGTVKLGDDGKPELSLEPYVSFGKPSGITYKSDEAEDAFDVLTEEQVAALKAGLPVK